MRKPVLLRACFSSLLLLLFHFAGAQSKTSNVVKDAPLRVEIKANSDDETYRIQTYKENGIIIFYKSVETVQDTATNWYFSFYDKNLQQGWIRSVPVQSDFEFISSREMGDTIFFIFQAKGKKKQEQPNLLVLRLSLPNLIFLANSARIDQDAVLKGFDISGEKLIAGYELKNSPAHLFFFNLGTGAKWDVGLTSESVSLIDQVSFDQAGFTITVAFKEQVAKKYAEADLAGFDFSGNQMHRVSLSTINPDRSLTELRFIPSDSSGYLVSGTYTLAGQGSGKGKQDALETHSGYFTSVIRGWEQKEIRFYNFLNLKNAANLLSAKEMLYVKKKMSKKSAYPEELSIGFNMLIYNLIKRGDQVLLFAETFYPQYHSENYTEFDFYGRPYTNSQTVFDGYRYTHGIVAGFDKSGNLLWDNTMEISDLITPRPEEKISLYFTGNDLVLCYVNEGKIAYKIVRGNEVIEKLDYVPLEMLNTEDKIVSESKSRIVYWYDNYFLCYGFQELKNLSADRTGKRWVFFINKIRFEE
jgi:hypothetical protein